jgi:hypothetical protein
LRMGEVVPAEPVIAECRERDHRDGEQKGDRAAIRPPVAPGERSRLICRADYLLAASNISAT